MEKETIGAWASVISAIISSSTLIIILFIQPWVPHVNYPPQVIDLIPDKTNPQPIGAYITWSAEVFDQENDKIFHKFWLKGPSTKNKWVEQTAWITSKNWNWTVTDADLGSNEIKVWTRDGMHKEIDCEITRDFNITAPIIFTETASNLAGKGVEFYNQGKYKEAFEAGNKSIYLDDSYAPGWFIMGAAQNMLGNYTKGLEYLNKATDLNRTYIEAWNGKGFALNSMGKYQEALICLDKATKLDPEYGTSWNNMGFSFMNLQNYTEAIRAFDAAIKLNFTSSWQNKGIALSEMGNYNESLKALDKAIEIDPFDALAWNGKSVVLMKLGRYPESEAARSRARELGYISTAYG
jgi:tetratricopeptide (TPR) repeat protein